MQSAKVGSPEIPHREYLNYLYDLYEEICDFLIEKRGSINPDALAVMFEKAASPMVYWLKGHPAPSPLTEEKRLTLLKGITKKYGLIPQGDSYTLGRYLSPEDFSRVSSNMKIAGLHYDRDRKSFVPDSEWRTGEFDTKSEAISHA